MSSLTTAARVSRNVRGLSLGGLCWALCCAAAAGWLFAAAVPDWSGPSSSGPQQYATKNIENVRAGERVWAYDVGSGRWAQREVVRPLTHDYEGDVVTVAAAGERIEATGNHPFWVVGGDGLAGRPPAQHVPAAEQDEAWRSGKGRWVDARHLQRGDLLLLRSGELATVEELASRRQKLKVYNLEVAGLHTYAVSTAGVLVHNKADVAHPADPILIPHPSERAARRAADRDAGMGKHGARVQSADPDDTVFRPGSRPRDRDPGPREVYEDPVTGNRRHHDPYGHLQEDGSTIPPHHGVEPADGSPTRHHTYPSGHNPATNR